MKKILKFFGFLTVVASAAAGAYYWFAMRQKKPQVELYFDDGSMMSFVEGSPEAEKLLPVAQDVLSAARR